MFNYIRKKFTALLAVVGVMFALTAVSVPTASAHVSAQLYGSKATANGYGNLFFRVPHASKDLSTVKIEVQIPSGVTGIKPQQIAGWSESVITADDGKVSVIWQGGNLPDTSFADFGISLKYPNTPGVSLYFPTVQTLNDGSTVAWIEIPAAGVDSHSLAKPAPSVKIESATSSHGGDGYSSTKPEDGHADAKSSITGDLAVKLNVKSARVIVDLSSVFGGQSVKLHLVRSNGEVLIYSGKLDSRGDAFASIPSKKSGTGKYSLKKGDLIHLVVGGETLLLGKVK
ncbi:MAG: YcnI family protein [Candidatus Paceibacterota bacterium]